MRIRKEQERIIQKRIRKVSRKGSGKIGIGSGKIGIGSGKDQGGRSDVSHGSGFGVYP